MFLSLDILLLLLLKKHPIIAVFAGIGPNDQYKFLIILFNLHTRSVCGNEN